MVPAEGRGGISPVKTAGIAGPENVAPKVTGQENLVFITEAVVRLQRQVVEVKLRTVQVSGQERSGQHVDV